MKLKHLRQLMLIIPLLILSLLIGGCSRSDKVEPAPVDPGSQQPETEAQRQLKIKRLAGLCKVWGFLKYYHPQVAMGQNDWDDRLLEAVDNVSAADDYDSYNEAIETLISRAGGINVDRVNLSDGTVGEPERYFDWMRDDSLFTSAVGDKLESLRTRFTPMDNWYVQYNEYGDFAQFGNEAEYLSPQYPDGNMRLLGLFRYWNAIAYFFPYRQDMDRDWGEVLEQYIPVVRDAADAGEYHLAMREIAAHINDSHGIAYSGEINGFLGLYYVPVELDYIEGKIVVTHVYQSLMEPADAVRVGDVIVECRNTTVEKFRTDIEKYLIASNEAVKQRELCNLIRKSSSAKAPFVLERNGESVKVEVTTYHYSLYNEALFARDAQKKRWAFLPGTNIGLIDMGVLKPEDVPATMTGLAGAEALIFDIRNYPNGTLFDIIPYLAPQYVPFVMFSSPDPNKPGAFYYEEPYNPGLDWGYNDDYFKGKVVLLVNRQSQSHAEFTAMCLQTAPSVTVIGSQTAGADGNVTSIKLPGGIVALFTGLGVYYPDGRPTQRIGIVPDIQAEPSLEGVRAGRDEVLERAVEFINNGN